MDAVDIYSKAENAYQQAAAKLPNTRDNTPEEAQLTLAAANAALAMAIAAYLDAKND